jgi:hypothetical protein
MNRRLLERIRDAATKRNMTIQAYATYVQRVRFDPHNDLTPAEQWDARRIMEIPVHCLKDTSPDFFTGEYEDSNE